MSHLKALDTQLKVAGVSDLQAAEVALARGLAVLLDSDPSLDWVWREYRFALRALREVLDGGVDDEWARLAERMGGTAVRNAAD